MLVVLTDSTQWPAVWRAAVAPLVVPSGWTGDSTIPVPPVSFGGGTLVLVATRTVGIGPMRLRVTSIRQCRRTGIIVVTSTQTGPGFIQPSTRSRRVDQVRIGTSTRRRGLDVVRVRGSRLHEDVIFEDRLQAER
ncbi:MAG: hypothetical protein LH467_06705 [Gemmatimonadaceae bacterium]|nr:hypothetical protein [Gemmatimonadaceae bacterium]